MSQTQNGPHHRADDEGQNYKIRNLAKEQIVSRRLPTPTDCTELCASDDGDGITCALHSGHSSPHAVSVWDFSGVGLYRETWSDYPRVDNTCQHPAGGAS